MSADAKKVQPWCCHADCEPRKAAEFAAYGNAGPEDETHGCAEHIGQLLGTPEGWEGEENTSWQVVYIGPAPEGVAPQKPNLPRLVGDVQHALSAAPMGGEAGLLAWQGHIMDVVPALLSALTGGER